MIQIEVKAGEVEKSLARFRGADILGAAFSRIQRPLEEALKTYPPQSHKPQPFKTVRQRRYFFWALRTGKLQVPYRRTDKLKRGWRVRFDLRGTAATLSISNISDDVDSSDDVDGVMGKRQWKYHQGTWTPAHITVKRFEPFVQTALREEVGRRR